jgi:ankyrin repeat protein
MNIEPTTKKKPERNDD